ncbi:tyrosine-type recombinase/integrase [Nonomuraea lactucae]|uniref:tyrosine-type recombinase/integrase n=1 Tax=Nonomuraea lactucae TaxID=2249762 RepID=UPI0013B3A6D5|nr:tyrosine-type recombinase/integrase [Nonomuraea lactucae]
MPSITSEQLPLAYVITPPSSEEAVFEAMVDGWVRKQRETGRFQASTLDFRERIVRRFAVFTGAHPWHWSSEQVDRWATHLTAELGRAQSTVCRYQAVLRLFCDYAASPRDGWPEWCEDRFGTAPAQICPEVTTVRQGDRRRRPMTREEVQLFLDHADSQVEATTRQGGKGAMARFRDATVFKVLYAWGLRCSEASALNLDDFRRHPRAPELGRFGALRIRSGGRASGLSQRRRTVLSVMPWAVEAVQEYLAEIRPGYRVSQLPALWPTERGGRLRAREIEERFAAYRDALGLDRTLTPLCLRSAYMAHLLEDGAELAFVQEQVGHRFGVTTAICAGSTEGNRRDG